MELLEQVQNRATRMIEGLEYLCQEDRLRQLLILEERRLGRGEPCSCLPRSLQEIWRGTFHKDDY